MRLQAPVLGASDGGGGRHLQQLRLTKGQMRRAPARSEGQRLGIHFLLMWMLKQGLALYPELPSFKLVTTLLPQPPQCKIKV